MSAVRTGKLLLLAALVIKLTGCGLKGDLYLPDKNQPVAGTMGETAVPAEPVTETAESASADMNSTAETDTDPERDGDKRKATDNLQSGDSAPQP